MCWSSTTRTSSSSTHQNITCSHHDDDDEIRSVLNQHAQLDLYSAISLKQTVRGQICRSTRTHYSDSEPIMLCSYCLVLRTYSGKNNTYQLHSLWYDPVRLEATIYHTRGEHPLYHRRGSFEERYFLVSLSIAPYESCNK